MRDRPSIALAPDARKQALASLGEFVHEELDESAGDLKLNLLLDFILTQIGPSIYNQAIADARSFFEDRISDLSGVCYYEEFPLSARRKR
jgi:uncharacterized protein (DUF2164 family)